MAVRKRMTIAEIARIAGVSPGAVSFALNDRPGVSKETRERILAVAREHNWQPSQAARALSGSRLGVVGLAVQRPARSLGSEAFFADLISGIQSGLSAVNASMLLRVVHDLDDELGAYRSWSGSHQVDGVILLDPRDDDPRLTLLEDLGLPVVLIGSTPLAPDGHTSVWIDDDQAGHELFDYLAALGHRAIAYVTGPAEFQHTRMRVSTLESLAGRGITVETFATDFAPAAAAAATRRVLSRTDRPTAIVYDNEVMAVAGMRVTQEMGIRVPGEVSVAAFDDSIISELMHPSITSLTRDTFDLGEKAATLLLAQLDSDEPLPGVRGPVPSLSVRESTARPGAGSDPSRPGPS
ncbi:LacI family DNA-binding transcriptional regulator [Planctomonas sp. JC2975]|uniref:LacI family DNA-binding transcriptional regulator n=1 Tax=Planctomonas sp. JC2975 TaxID=2729626 RepID=UPI00147428A1|nr:LacI family DNA-binding transcriptional regulator [Planctomonas sp. JC2975]NNC13636.1 LacI family DNA-binding transcriptional regulator [Planctomonas sp. JC2975]